MAKRKKTARRDIRDIAVENMLLAEEDLAAMRPALAVAPELVVQTLARRRRRRPQKQTKKKVKARRSSATKKQKSSPKKRKATKAARGK